MIPPSRPEQRRVARLFSWRRATVALDNHPTRISAVGAAGGIGIILVVTGALLHQPNLPDAIKVVLIIALQLATSAIGSIAIARSAYLANTPMRRKDYDDLASNEETI